MYIKIADALAGTCCVGIRMIVAAVFRDLEAARHCLEDRLNRDLTNVVSVRAADKVE